MSTDNPMRDYNERMEFATQCANDEYILDELKSNNGAILWHQVSEFHAFDDAFQRGVIGFDNDTDCYTHPRARKLADGGGFAMLPDGASILNTPTLNDTLIAVYKQFETIAGIPLDSADEHLTDERLSPAHRRWLAAFVELWDASDLIANECNERWNMGDNNAR